ncbi:MAG TPA: FecR domain-containing protein [Candidatus Sulfotelmatobacter sp.]|nr:FecR domain-containing protein [Candidatus Sulfotelmatobacter sp.]
MDTGKNKPENEPMAAKDDYLWDGSGEPDPEIQRLEALVGKFRYDRPAPVFPDVVPRRGGISFPWQIRWFPALAISAAVIAIVVGSFLVQRRKPTPTAVAGWDVSRLAGSPRIGPNVVTKAGHLAIGQVLETDQQSRASLRAEDTGQIEMEPNSRLRLLNMGSGRKNIALDRGTIHTYIWAPPGQFVVETPSAVTVDLGCAYTLHVDDSGAGLVRTSMGWVGFKLNGHESFIPAGAACATRPKIGPGTPYFEDASPGLKAALARFDFADTTPQQRADDLAMVLSTSRKHDGLTLWHLLSRVELEQRVFVFDRLRALAPPPPGVTKEGILLLDQPMLDLWWNELGFDDISVWRYWERSWSGASSGSATPVSTK